MMPDELCGASLSHFFFFFFLCILNQTPSTAVVSENATTLFLSGAQKHFADYEISPDFLLTTTQFAFWVNVSFNGALHKNWPPVGIMLIRKGGSISLEKLLTAANCCCF